MRVGITGAANMGSAFARRLSGAGHDVIITSRTLDEAKRVAKTLPERVEAVEQSQLANRADILGDSSGGGRVQVFYAGDDENAKRTVRSLIDSMRFDPIDAGPLRNARLLEPLGMLNIYFGYMAKMGTDIAPAVQKVSGQAVTQARSPSADVQRSRESERDARA